MGMGTGIDCERCGEQISMDIYNFGPYFLKSEGQDYDLCGSCVKEIRKKDWDNKLGEAHKEMRSED